ncbi:MAG: redoxin domain-containing protein [Candidatus Rokubacteria bacterium]|nr:redoxin domain-containing protein [Candidatus Rokubacteria bacterium]
MMQAMPTRPRAGTRALAVIALLLALGTVVAFVGLLQALIPLRPAWYLGTLALALVLGAASVWRARHWLTISAFALSVLLFGAAVVFNFVAMRVPVTKSVFVVGQPAPDFTLPDSTGKAVRLADYRGQKPVVLVFYRGYW